MSSTRALAELPKINAEPVLENDGHIVAPSHKQRMRFVWAFTASLLLVAGITFGPPIWGPTSYMASSIDKHALLHSASSPKIILVGGSNVAMSLDSPKIEQALKRPVVNMALAASLGLRFELEEVKEDLHKGDLLVVMPEYEYFAVSKPNQTDVRLDGCANLLELAQTNPAVIKWILPNYFGQPKGLKNLGRDLARLFYKKVDFYKRGICNLPKAKSISDAIDLFVLHDTYSRRSNFNRNGDFVGHLSQPSTNFDMINCDIIWFPYKFNNEAEKVLRSASDLAKRKGAKLVILPPSVPLPVVQRKEKIFDDIYSHLDAVESASVLARPSKYALPRPYFFDCNYHLNAQGREARTKLLISDLRAWLGGQQKFPSSRTLIEQ